MSSKEELRIRQLVDQSNYQKFELTILFTGYFGLLALLVAILGVFLGVVNDFLYRIILIVIILFLMVCVYQWMQPKVKLSLKKIREISTEIDNLYKTLQKN